MERDFAEDFRGASKRDQRIEQSRSVTNQRNAQPDQSHHLFLVLPQDGFVLPHPAWVIIVCRAERCGGNGGCHR